MTKHPARQPRWREVDSSNVSEVGWDAHGNMYVRFKSGAVYMYRGVTRQRVVACARSQSVGSYLNKTIIPNYEALRVA
jgi:KTSC domain